MLDQPRTQAPSDALKRAQRARALDRLARACKTLTGGDLVRGEPTVSVSSNFRTTPQQWELGTYAKQDCVASTQSVKARASEIVRLMAITPAEEREKELDGALLESNARRILIELGDPQPVMRHLESFLIHDGRLDMSQDELRGVTNWTVNYVVRAANILRFTSDCAARPLLDRLADAIIGPGADYARTQLRAVKDTIRCQP
jgi:hypothetical protein